jgi:transcriptional regulator with XRE-family HTH domain
VSRIDVGGLGGYIREQRGLAQLSLRQVAATAGVSNPYLSQIERGLRKPSAEILREIAKALRISVESLYVRAGILEDRGGDVAVTTSLMSDETISDRQRRVLLDIYAAFQTENAAHPATSPLAARGDDTDTTAKHQAQGWRDVTSGHESTGFIVEADLGEVVPSKPPTPANH